MNRSTYNAAIISLRKHIDRVDEDTTMFLLRVYSKISRETANLSKKQKRRIRNKFNKSRKKNLKHGLYEGATCVCCGEEPKEIHHIIPISRGGTNHAANLVHVCVECHKEIHREDKSVD